GGEIAGHRVNRLGEIFPCPRQTSDLGLAAELAFGADLARDAGDLRGKGTQAIHHRVDGILELKDLASDIDGDLLGQIAIGNCGGYFGNVADLRGQVGSHGIDRIREVLPGAGAAFDDGLAAEFAFGADFPGDAGDFRGERAQLVHHRVDSLFKLEDFAMDVD